jgi:ADP-heptose:LPS heptosyltransferase
MSGNANMPEPKRILVLNMGQLGDLVMSLPAVAAIRARFPRAQLTVMTGIAAGQAMELAGLADRVIAVDRVALRDGSTMKSLRRIAQLVRETRRARYDMVIDLHSLSETNLLGYLSGAPLRLFANRGGRSLDLLGSIPSPPGDRERHLVDFYLDVLAPLGVAGASREPRLPTRPEDDETIDRLLASHGVKSDRPLVGIFPGAGNALRQWPLERFAEVGARLTRDDKAHIVLLLGPEERGLKEQARALFSEEAIVVEPSSLSELASAAARLDLLISNDTGPMHVAAAMGTPVVVISTKLHRVNRVYMPVGEHHKIVQHSTIAEISSREVYEAAHSVLAKKAIPAAETKISANMPEALRK